MTLLLEWKRTGPREMRSTCGRFMIEKSGDPAIYLLHRDAGGKWVELSWWTTAAAAQSAASDRAFREKQREHQADG